MDGVNAEQNWEKRIEEGIPWFKITEVHLVGFNMSLARRSSGVPQHKNGLGRAGCLLLEWVETLIIFI